MCLNNNLSMCTVSCLFRSIEWKSTRDICVLHWLQPTFMVFCFLDWVCLVIAVFYDLCRNICQSPTIFGQFIVVCGLEWLQRTSPLWIPFGVERTLYLFITHLGRKLLCNNVSFTTWWPGSRCASALPPSVSSLKTVPSWTPVFLILCPRSPCLGQVPAGCDQNRPDVCIITVMVFNLNGKRILMEAGICIRAKLNLIKVDATFSCWVFFITLLLYCLGEGEIIT